MLDYTGHPLADIGAFTIAANARKSDISKLTIVDLDMMAEYMLNHFFDNPVQSFIWSMYPNSGFTQPSVRKNQEKRKEYVEKIKQLYRPTSKKLEEPCVFCGAPATFRAFREHIPLVGGIHTYNFYPNGQVGIPICGPHFLSLQVFFLGGAICEGRSLIIHSDNTDLTYRFAAKFLQHNRRMINLLELQKKKKLIGTKYPKTIIINTLIEIEQELAYEEYLGSITAFWLTNFGTKADIDIFYLPHQITRFLAKTQTPKFQESWNNLVNRAWHTVSVKKSGDRRFEVKVNYIYEDIFDLPDSARYFIYRHFLRQPIAKTRHTKKNHPLLHYSLPQDAKLVSWTLLELFLKEILLMDRERIESIRRMGDTLANYVQHQDARLFTKLFRARHYQELSLELLRAKKRAAEKGVILYSFDDFIEVFAEGEDVPRSDWSLARDLVLVRMIDKLQEVNWFSGHEDILKEANREQEIGI